jgi:hypothetical protein
MLTKKSKSVFVVESVTENDFVESDINISEIRQQFNQYLQELKDSGVLVGAYVETSSEELTVKEKVKLIREHLKNKCGFIASNQWINAHLDDFTFEEEQVIEKLAEVTITLDETVEKVLDATFKITPEEELFDLDRVVLDGDYEISKLWLTLRKSLNQLIDLRTKVKPFLEKTLYELKEFEVFCHIENNKEILNNQFGLETVTKTNYERILEAEDYFCILREKAPIDDYFRAYWLFMWFEKRKTTVEPRLNNEIPKAKLLNYLDSRFCTKGLNVANKRDYFYQLYLKVQPYLVRYYSYEKAEQQNLFSNEF